MKRKTVFIFLFIGVYLILISTSPLIRALTFSTSKTISPRKAISYTAHSPIKIFGNASFKNTAQSEGWPGDGSESNPYVIEGLEITGSSSDLTLILIEKTDVYFKISNNSLDGKKQTQDGIKLFSVSNGMILDNEVKNCLYAGISIQNSATNTISGNTVSKNGRSGTWKANYWKLDLCGMNLIASHSNEITNNTITSNNIHGISLDASSNNLLLKNEISGQEVGLGLFRGANYNTISENEIFSCPDTGIFSYDATQGDVLAENSHNIVTKNIFHKNRGTGVNMGAIQFCGSNNTVSYNEFYDNSISITIGMRWHGVQYNWQAQNIIVAHNIIYTSSIGILVKYANQAVIMNNSIYQNSNYGLEITNQSSQTIVKWNDFLDNNVEGDSQAVDNGINNTFSSNYWGSLSTDSYSIAGTAGNVDSSPLASLKRVEEYSQVYFPATSDTSTTTTSTSKTSLGWQIILVLPIIFVFGIIQKKKRM